MKLDKYLRSECIRIGLKATEKWAAIEELLQVLIENGLVADAGQVRADLIAREKKMSTGMELGLALPHAKSDGAKGLAIALGIAPQGVDFDSLDGNPAHIIFLVVSRKDVTGPHIECLADIATLFKREDIRAKLPEARTPAAALRLILGRT